jgi:hypothetical protein
MISRWLKGALPFVVTLVAGIAIGVVHERFSPERSAPPHDAAMVSASGFDDKQIMQAISDVVRPDSAQRVALHDILRKRQGEIDSAWQVVRPDVLAAMEGTHRDVMAILRPEQRAQFLRFVAHDVPLPDSLDLRDPQASAGWLRRLHDHLWQLFRGPHGQRDSGATTAH